MFKYNNALRISVTDKFLSTEYYDKMFWFDERMADAKDFYWSITFVEDNQSGDTSYNLYGKDAREIASMFKLKFP